MEKIPVSKNVESEPMFDELATALEEVIITITTSRHNITEMEQALESNQIEFDALVGMLDSTDLKDMIELEKIKAIQDKFAVTVNQDIAQMKSIISELESIHGRELKMFEDLKAVQREKDFGSSGTTH
jgi:hypothetical protein